MHSYWKTNKLLHCSYISNIISRKIFESVTRCLHLVDLAKIISDNSSPNYDKLAKILWFINEIKSRCESLWNCAKFVTIDEMMIANKDKYSNMRQYMHIKSYKWRTT